MDTTISPAELTVFMVERRVSSSVLSVKNLDSKRPIFHCEVETERGIVEKEQRKTQTRE